MTQSRIDSWRSPPLLRIIAVWQIAGGATLTAGLMWAAAHGTRLDWAYKLMAESVIVGAIWGGIALWRGHAPGFLASSVLQLLQIVNVVSPGFVFVLILGPVVELIVPTHAAASVAADLRATLTFYLGPARLDVNPAFSINLGAVAVLGLLVFYHRRTGQPWINPPERRMEWNRARAIGAYQIAAGAFGMFNAASATAYARASLLFGIIVIASGVALMRQARGGEIFAAAVNAAQVPALSVGKVTYLVRSGVSCIVALASGQASGLHVQFDLGATINEALAPHVDAFVGVNVTALAVVIVLLQYRANRRWAEERGARHPGVAARP